MSTYYTEESHILHGIDVDFLFQDGVINNKICFWNIAQCQTDRLHYFYHSQKYLILNEIFRCRKAIKSSRNQDIALEDVRETDRLAALQDLDDAVVQIEDLKVFLTESQRRFCEVVGKFDEHHECDTLSQELETLHTTHEFLDGTILQLLREHAEKVIESGKAEVVKDVDMLATSLTTCKYYYIAYMSTPTFYT